MVGDKSPYHHFVVQAIPAPNRKSHGSRAIASGLPASKQYPDSNWEIPQISINSSVTSWQETASALVAGFISSPTRMATGLCRP